jgi:hypothetical protein
MVTIHRAAHIAALLLTSLFLLSCGNEGSEEARLAFENSQPSTELPAGHPPIEAASPAPATDAPATSVAGVVWSVPDGWEPQGARSMRVATYTIRTNREGTAECAVFFFGTRQGGDVQDNIDRWVNQFQQPDGSPSADRAKTAKTQKSGWPLTTVDVSGTYNGGMVTSGQSQEPQVGFRMLAAIVEGPEGAVFFKLTGPEAVVESSAAEFSALLESLRPAG